MLPFALLPLITPLLSLACRAQYQLSYSAIAYTSTGVLLIVLCIIVAMRKGINTAIDVLKTGTDALRGLPGLLFFPCTNVICIGIFLVWWCFVAACLQSAGTVTPVDLSADVKAGLNQLTTEYGASAAAIMAGSLNRVNASLT